MIKTIDYDSLSFLNTKAHGLFKNCNVNNINFVNFKKNLLFALNTIENVFRGTFHSDLFVTRADEAKFEKLFPNGFRLFNNNIKQIAHFLDTVRNCCAHSFLSDDDIKIFGYYYSQLDNEPKFNPDIKYAQNGIITIAGLVFLIFNFLREQTIIKLCKDNPVFGLITCGKLGRDDGSLFVSRISHVDLENNPIREITGSDVEAALLGQYLNKLSDDGSFAIALGAPGNPLYRVSGLIKDNHVIINSDSMTMTYYESDYDVAIEYEKGFIELANKLPELLIVDLLKEQDYRVFNKEVYQKLVDKWNLISKLNYPKYYEDKNIKTIFVPNEVADYRVMNTIINNAVASIAIELEKRIYKKYKIISDSYSRFSKALSQVIKNNNVNSQVVALRNFAVHGRAFGEFNYVGSKIFYYSPEFAFDSLRLLLLELQKTDLEVFELASKKISGILIGKICSYRYSQVEKESVIYINNYPNGDSKELHQKRLYVDHSMFDTTELDELNSLCENECYIYKVIVESSKETLYFTCCAERDELIKEFCAKHGFDIKEEGGLTVKSFVIK